MEIGESIRQEQRFTVMFLIGGIKSLLTDREFCLLIWTRDMRQWA